MSSTATAFILTATVLAAGPKLGAYPPKVGEVHPPLAMWDLEHQAELSLAQHRGKKVLLVHFASW